MKAFLKKVYHGALAAVSTPTAVKQEKSLATFFLLRGVIAVGGSAATADIVVKGLQAAGWL
jgi:hypothetical protein